MRMERIFDAREALEDRDAERDKVRKKSSGL
jgi:hypothetical protein